MRIAHISDIHIAELPEKDPQDWIEYVKNFLYVSIPLGLASTIAVKVFNDPNNKKKLIKLWEKLQESGKNIDKKVIISTIAGFLLTTGILGIVFRRQLMKLFLSLQKDKLEFRNILIESLAEQNIDHILISGDLTNVASEREFEKAKEFLAQLKGVKSGIGITIVPGNHDVQDVGSASDAPNLNFFNSFFHEYLPDGGIYPFVHQMKDVKLFGLNSVTPGKGFGTEGMIDGDQLDVLKQELCQDSSHVSKIIVLHHHLEKQGLFDIEPGMPPLQNGKELLEISIKNGVQLILHGHKHDPYKKQDKSHENMPIFCAGSTTRATSWFPKTIEYTIYEFDTGRLLDSYSQPVTIYLKKDKDTRLLGENDGMGGT